MSLQPVPVQLEALRQRGLALGMLGLAAAALGGLTSPPQFFRSWLFAFLFLLGVPIGCQSILMIQHLTGGLWGLVIRRILEAGSRTLRYAWVPFVPLAFGLPHVFVWANHQTLASDHHLHEAVSRKAEYLNVPFFLGRAAFYFAVWAVLAQLLSRWSAEQDRGFSPRLASRLRGLSGGGLLLMGFTITFSSVDWGMSLDPRWFSTIYGVLFMVGQALSAMAFSIVILTRLASEPSLARVVSAHVMHDLGKLLFAFVMLWAYVNLSQFLIVWSGNLPEEIPWYILRLSGGWRLIAGLLVIAHFALPFLMLLSRDIKRNASVLAVVAGGLLLMRLLDLFWLVGPELHERGFAVHWLDLAATVGLGGLWLHFFARELAASPLLPVDDPELAEAHAGAH